MAAQDYYDTNIPDQTIDVSASTRKFQRSIIITQDARKNGILSFLQSIETVEPPPLARATPQTVRPRRSEGY